MIDDTDMKILSIVQENGRMCNADIAREIGMAPSATLERIRKLEKKGVIKGYEAKLCPQTLDVGLLAFVFVQTEEQIGKAETGTQLAKLPEVQEVHHIAGEDCYLAKVRVANPEALGRLLRNQFGAIETVTSTRTTIVLETIKETSHLPIRNQFPEIEDSQDSVA